MVTELLPLGDLKGLLVKVKERERNET